MLQLKERIINFFIPKTIIRDLLDGKVPRIFRLLIKLLDLTRMCRFYLSYGHFQGLKNREGLTEYDIPPETLDGTTKKHGIATYARLKNASDFLQVSVESILPYVDEVILVENGSTDTTRTICEQLHAAHPTKIKIFRYEREVYPLFSQEFKTCPEDSVHNFAYMSNFALSKVSYRYALKIDDDGIFLPDQMEQILMQVRTFGLDHFHITPLINIQRHQGNFVLGATNYRSTFAGLFGDIGIHPVSPRIYFHSNGQTEGYVHNYRSQFGPMTFLHLKLLKASRGLHNYHQAGHQYLNTTYTDHDFLPLQDKYIALLHEFDIYEDR